MKGTVLGDTALVMADTDTVATALEELPPATEIAYQDSTIEIRDSIPFGHKFALIAHDPGETVQKYGEVIGRATQPIAVGEHVHTHNVESTRGRGDIAEEAEESA